MNDTVLEERATACFHCGDTVPRASAWQLEVDGRPVRLCCPGCVAAASTILGCGLGDYYRHRESLATKPANSPEQFARYEVYDDAALQARAADGPDGSRELELTVSGLVCASCAWLLEARLGQLPGVVVCEVNLATRRARVVWMPRVAKLSTILAASAELGYEARPFTPDARRAQIERENAELLRTLGVAGLFGMQVMMIAFAFYTGGIEPPMERFLRWTCLVLTLPLVTYCTAPFARGAWAALRTGSLNMEVPVTAAIALAFAGSVWNTVAGDGPVYYDSVAMFVTLLLASRQLEARARATASARLETFTALVPDAACRVVDEGGAARLETVPALRLAPGDVVLVRPGETVPADGVVCEGAGTLDESILTGEAEAQARGIGDNVLGGSVNLESPLRVRVTAVAAESFAGHLGRLVAQAARARPPGLDVTERIARWFVAGVLLASVLTAAYWLVYDPSNWFAPTLAVLVVSCPCALAIAVPAALAAAHSSLLEHSIAVLDGAVLERLARASHVLFDKTGTLTLGRLHLRSVECFDGATEARVLACAGALAQASQHAVARALREVPLAARAAPAEACRGISGAGIEGLVDGQPAAMGAASFVAAWLGRPLPEAAAGSEPGAACAKEASAGPPGKETWVARDGRLLGRLEFDDAPRPEAAEVCAWLTDHGYHTAILSGDRAAVVEGVARAVGIGEWGAGLVPAGKVERVRELQARGAVVAMVGDGVNDAPVLAQADVSVAVADSAAAAKQQAGALLLASDLRALPRLIATAVVARRIMRQNLAWALAYNVVALPLAAAGELAPWLAALGMSASSLVVVVNALRVRRLLP